MFAKITKSVFLIKKSNIQCVQVKATREISKTLEIQIWLNKRKVFSTFDCKHDNFLSMLFVLNLCLEHNHPFYEKKNVNH